MIKRLIDPEAESTFTSAEEIEEIAKEREKAIPFDVWAQRPVIRGIGTPSTRWRRNAQSENW